MMLFKLLFFLLNNSIADIWLIDEISSPHFCHSSRPPSKKPTTLSNPTLDNLITASFLFWLSQINKILVLGFFKICPTHGANFPFKPIKIEPTICPFINVFWCLTSKTNAPFFCSFLKFSTLRLNCFLVVSDTLEMLFDLLSFTFFIKYFGCFEISLVTIFMNSSLVKWNCQELSAWTSCNAFGDSYSR